MRKSLALWGLTLCVPVCSAATLEELEARIERLDAENRALKEKVERLEAVQGGVPSKAAKPAPPAGSRSTGLGPPSSAPPASAIAAPESVPTPAPASAAAPAAAATPAPVTTTAAPLPAPVIGPAPGGGVVRLNSPYAYRMLDPTTDINRKHLVILESRQKGVLEPDSLILGGAVTAVVDYMNSDARDRFGYLMRQPGNQIGTTFSEAALHTAQFKLTGNLGSWLTAYTEILYDPSTSFGAGSITTLDRNQVSVRSGYLVFGNPNLSPFYGAIGKMPTPFGLTDTVNPFSASSVFHAFGGLAYGVQAGYMQDGLNVAAMAVQGGAQFRGLNSPVGGTAVPAKLNNYALNLDYTLKLGNDAQVLAGASYERGSAYCQPFRVTAHFQPCQDNNPAYDVYARLKTGRWLLQAEFAKTVDVWPATFNPALPQFPASKVSSFSLGTQYRMNLFNRPLFLSAEYSRFTAGSDGAPWESQDQFVLGVAAYVMPTVKLFGEYVRVKGFIPLPSIGTTIASSSEVTNVFLMGVNAAY